MLGEKASLLLPITVPLGMVSHHMETITYIIRRIITRLQGGKLLREKALLTKLPGGSGVEGESLLYKVGRSFKRLRYIWLLHERQTSLALNAINGVDRSQTPHQLV